MPQSKSIKDTAAGIKDLLAPIQATNNPIQSVITPFVRLSGAFADTKVGFVYTNYQFVRTIAAFLNAKRVIKALNMVIEHLKRQFHLKPAFSVQKWLRRHFRSPCERLRNI